MPIMRSMYADSDIENMLSSFDPAERRAALDRLASTGLDGEPVEQGDVNMHCHSFFSYNAEGWSPSRLAWEARNAGLYAAGLCDFDVLDGLEEFIDAGLVLRLRTAVHMETRAFLEEFEQVDINSPGEPGVIYIMGAGFPRVPDDPELKAGLDSYRAGAALRNESLIARINARIPKIAVDYGKDVIPLTPAGAPTERHIVRAYISKAGSAFREPLETARFWARLFEGELEDTLDLMADAPRMEEAVRARLVKQGGLGYEQPSSKTFPPADEFIRWVVACDAIPTIAWLDGSSEGEDDPEALLEVMTGKGCAAINIIPDRNWNHSNPEVKAAKRANLAEIVRLSEAMELPVNIGTEMNKRGLPFSDRLEREELKPFRRAFTLGARIMVGQSALSRYAGFSYMGSKAFAEFGDDKTARNEFFARVGSLPPIGKADSERLLEMDDEDAYTRFRDLTASVKL